MGDKLMEEYLDKWDNNPREMLVWNDNPDLKFKRKVVAIIDDEVRHPVVAIDCDGDDLSLYKHCKEIKTQRRMTNKELSRWLRERPDREVKSGNSATAEVYGHTAYPLNKEDEEVDYDVYVREGDSPWFVPFKEEEND